MRIHRNQHAPVSYREVSADNLLAVQQRHIKRQSALGRRNPINRRPNSPVEIKFNNPIDSEDINLYDTQNAALGALAARWGRSVGLGADDVPAPKERIPLKIGIRAASIRMACE